MGSRGFRERNFPQKEEQPLFINEKRKLYPSDCQKLFHPSSKVIMRMDLLKKNQDAHKKALSDEEIVKSDQEDEEEEFNNQNEANQIINDDEDEDHDDYPIENRAKFLKQLKM
jgi:hypothetical protein